MKNCAPRQAILRKDWENGETLDQILPEAFVVAREAAKRTIGQRHYDVQLLGGLMLPSRKNRGNADGEGKTW